MTESATDTNTILTQAKNFLRQHVELYGDIQFAQSPWTTLENEVMGCNNCPLAQTRKNVVFGDGDRFSKAMLIGEAPGAEEDRKGRTFIGPAGQLLDKILQAIQMTRQDVFITNILKCRPPQNRDPEAEEIASCLPFLKQQLALMQPKIILALGRFAGQKILETDASLAQMRGKVHQKKSYAVIVTYHPAALLRHPEWKRPTWEDVKLFRQTYEKLMQSS